MTLHDKEKQTIQNSGYQLCEISESQGFGSIQCFNEGLIFNDLRNFLFFLNEILVANSKLTIVLLMALFKSILFNFFSC